jgi:hypothetical protein
MRQDRRQGKVKVKVRNRNITLRYPSRILDLMRWWTAMRSSGFENLGFLVLRCLSSNDLLLNFDPSRGNVVMVARLLFCPVASETVSEGSKRGVAVAPCMSGLATTGANCLLFVNFDDDRVSPSS